ncbi:hypothetical protein HDU97_000630 [Phlyctochytrium planicorne]|nr:hypothetical protein HDU97_000630 [Phlyctochytrium planicorne]
MVATPAVKRLMKEYADLQADPSPEFVAAPLEDNIFDWHFTVRGPQEGGFLGGRYHGRIMFPVDYPFKPPAIMFMTPNGRFEMHKKICLSITNHHPESWRPSWGIRSALTALISFFPTPGNGAIGALDYTEEERKKLAKKSLDWRCDVCGGGGKEGLEDMGGETKPVEGDEEGISFVVKEATAADSLANGKDEAGAEAEAAPTPNVTTPAENISPASELRQRPVAVAARAGDNEVVRAPPPLAAPVLAPVANNIPAPVATPVAPPAPPPDPVLEARKKQIDTLILIIFAVLTYIVIRRVSIVYGALTTPSY